MAKSKKKPFKPVEAKVNFPEMEERILKNWYENGVVDKYLKKNDSSDKYFSFLDGPITANNPMGVHHGWGRTYKDLWQRFYNMRGFKQRFQNGFDAQGLWVEVEVEKDLGFKNKKEIEDYGVEKFVKKCKKRVRKYAKIQTEQSKRLGYFMDWENSYFTMSDQNNYMIWHFLKICHEHGWLYKGMDSVPWCPRCETAISQHEMLTEDYKEVEHESIYMVFPVKGKKREFLLVWTTTPWTIPANIAVAVDKKLDYSLVRTESGNKYWIAKDAVKRVFGDEKVKPIKSVKGSKLKGLKYETVFDDLPVVQKTNEHESKKMHKVILTNDRIMPINTSEGTGLVHTAVSAGSEDFKLGKELGLPMIPVIDNNANYLGELGFLSGKNAKKDPRLVLDYMLEKDKEEDQHWVYKIENYKHRYPACWRCKTELVWRVTDEWYISMDKSTKVSNDQSSEDRTLRQRMIKVAKSIEWIPEFGLKRELDWLRNMDDWLISKKNRYWGLALPIWECQNCGHFEVIGGKEELKERAVEGWQEMEGNSPHKPQIDAVKIKCSECSKLTERVEPVGNPWLDAGIVAYSTVSKDNKGEPLYTTDKEKWKKWIPADFITESFPGQFKNWFYSLIAMSTVLEDVRPTDTIFGHGTLLAEDGRPMHKSWGNSIEFSEGAKKIGVDVMRWMYLMQDPSKNLLFGYKTADETRRQFHLTLWNIYRFFVTYANLDNWNGYKKLKLDTDNVLDKWILLRLSQTNDNVVESLKEYDAKTAVEEIGSFVSDITLWYIRRSRNRVGPNVDNTSDKQNFYSTCFFVLEELSRILAPFTPFISEEIYKNLTDEESVHLMSWPDVDDKKIFKKLEKEKELLKDMQLVRKIVELGHAQRKENEISVRQPLSKIKVSYHKEKLNKELTQLIKDELNVKKIVWKKRKENKEPKAKLDTNLTKELKEEGDTRNLIRKIQIKRKKMGLELTDKVNVKNEWLPSSEKLKNKIKRKALVNKLIKGDFEVEPLN